MKPITERASPHVFRVVALPTPEEREKSQMYMQRDVQHFPAAGEIMIFDRTWHNRAGVERVMGFCTEEESKRFLTLVPGVEQAMVDLRIMLIKYWREVSGDEQALSLERRIDDPLKVWKLSEARPPEHHHAPLGQKPYEPIRRAKVTLPDRDEAGDYIEAQLARRYIPTPF